MTGRKYHMAHCPSCEYFYKGAYLFECKQKDLSGNSTILLEGSTAIKCTHYYKKKEVK